MRIATMLLAASLLTLGPAALANEDTEAAPAEAAPAPTADDADDGATAGDVAETAEESDDSSALSFGFGVDWYSQYFFRGIVQETAGLIAQPWAELGISLYEGSGFFSGASLSFGLWNSFHSKRTLAISTVPEWYEADVYVGTSFGFFEQVELGLTYTAYTSPNGAFGTTHELGLGLGWDDSGLYGVDWFGGVAPSATFAFELDGGADGGEEGVFFALGVEPSFTLYDGAMASVGVGVPLEIGLSADKYYEDGNGQDEAFGYFSAGVGIGVGLGMIPESWGAWEIAMSATVLTLGPHTKVDDTVEFIGSVGLSGGL